MKFNVNIVRIAIIPVTLLIFSGNAGCQIIAKDYSYQDKPLVNPNPSAEAVALFRYLQDMYGKKILSGQMWAPWGVNEIDYVYSVTGKKPAIAGFDLINEYQNNGEILKAKNYWIAGGIPTIMWHWGAPGVGEGYENSKATIDINQCFIEGTVAYNSMWTELEKKADHLELLRDANVPVLWRPFHELNGGWFWWGKQGPELFKKLWITMYNYFTFDRGLNNLIWVFCMADPPDGDWYPGDAYVDIAGSDTYNGGSGPHESMFNNVLSIIEHNPMPVAYHECGVPPRPDLCLEKGAMWSWWMQWHTSWLTDTDQDYLNEVYNHELIITLDEVPDILTKYSWDDDCVADTVIMNNKIDNGNWRTDINAMVQAGSSVLLSPESEHDGSWSWTGCAVSGNEREQIISRETSCTATVTFTNTCGASSSAVFNVSGTCIPTTITPYLAVSGGDWQLEDTVTIDSSMEVYLGPQPANGGSWSWSGPDLFSTTREVIVSPSKTSTYTASYTNDCGATSTHQFIIHVRKDNLMGVFRQLEEIYTVYPSYFRNFLHIDLTDPGLKNITCIEIISIDGRKVFSACYDTTSFTVNTSSMKQGIYVLRLFTGKNEYIKQIVRV